MKRLPRVRTGLARLRLFRSTVRLGVMGSTILSILLWALAVAFVLDYGIGMDALERSIVLVGIVAVAIWTVGRYAVPALSAHESDAALAVLVDAKRGLHSNLVAAIEFDDEDRPQYGSEQLREEVVEQTGRIATGMNFIEGFSRRALMNRLLVFAATLAICLIPSALFPAYTGAFLDRLVLGDTNYPTGTVITKVDVTSGGRIAEGSPVTFEVHWAGDRPEWGEVRLVSDKEGGTEATIKLLPDEERPHVRVATFPRVLENLSCTVHLGDAYPKELKVTVVALPRVRLRMIVERPKYVLDAEAATSRPGAEKVAPKPSSRRQIIVPEGSTVIPVITVTNDKKIVSGTLTFEKKDSKVVKLKQNDRGEWVPEGSGGALAEVTEMVRFQIKLIDSDGLSPANAIRGTVHVSADLPPRVALWGYSRRVLPNATPRLDYKAVDDYALGHLTLHVAIMDADGRQIKTTQTPLELRKPKEQATRLLEQQEKLRDAVRAGTLNEANVTRWTAGQGAVVESLRWLVVMAGTSETADMAIVASETARRDILGKDKPAALDEQGKVIGALTQLIKELARQSETARNKVDRYFCHVPLADEGLQKGYQVLVTLEAVDHRDKVSGEKVDGKSRRSEKWIFEVSDQQGVLAGMELLTEQMDKKLDEVIRAQVEAGK